MKNRHNLLKIISLVFMGIPVLAGCDSSESKHVHVYSDLVAQRDPTCTENGMAAYYTCSDCDAYFDANYNEVKAEDLVIAALGHDMEYHSAVDGIDCEHTGTVEYYSCSRCHKNFSDENGLTEITELDNQTCGNHTLVEHAAVAATNCSETGTIKYYECSVCNKKFLDEECKNEVTNLSDGVYGPHILGELIPEVPSTHYEEGTKAHYDCSVCGKHFADQNAETEITDLKIECVAHTFDQKVATSDYCVTEETINSEGVYYYSCECGAKGSETFTVPKLTVNKNWDLKDGVYSNKADNAITSVSGITGTEDGFTYSGDVEVTRMEGEANAQTKVSLVFFANLGDETQSWESIDYEYYCFYFNFQSGATSIAHVVEVEGVNKWKQVSVVSKAKLPSAIATKYDNWFAGEAGTKATFNFEIVFDGETLVTFIDGEKISQCNDLLTNATLLNPIKKGTTLGIRSQVAYSTSFSNIKCSTDYGPTLTLNGNGGEVSGSTTKKLTKGIATTLPEATKEGSSFKGWATSATGEPVYNTTDSYVFSEDTELFAIFSQTYTLSYACNVYGAPTMPESKEISGDYELTADDLPTLSNPYYTFDGWYDGESKADVGTKFSANTVLTAKFVMRTGYTNVSLKDNKVAAGATITDYDIGSQFNLTSSAFVTMNESFSTGTIEFAYTTPSATPAAVLGCGIILRASSLDTPTNQSIFGKYNGLFLQLPDTKATGFTLYGPSSSGSVAATIASENAVAVGTTYWVKINVEEYQTSGDTPVTGLRITIFFNDVQMAVLEDSTKMVEGGTAYASGTGIGLRRNVASAKGNPVCFDAIQFKAA